MKKFLALCLAGCNDYEILSFWTGATEGKQTGANGKSALCTLMAKALGDYYTEGTPSIITGKRENQRVQILQLHHLKTSGSYHFKILILVIISTCLFGKD